jgi:beta-mannosidase
LSDAALRAAAGRARVAQHDLTPLASGWETASCPPDRHADPSSIDALEWFAATVPGTAAAALRDAGLWSPHVDRDFDAEDWWFRTDFRAAPAGPGEALVLELDGIATVADVYLNGRRIATVESMFARHAVDVGALLRDGENTLAIRCRALGPLLEQRRSPRARWRTRLVNGNLRFYRTMLLGRAPGFAPGPAAVGPWRPVRLVRRRIVSVERLHLAPSVRRGDPPPAELDVEVRLRGHDAAVEEVEVELSGPAGEILRGELSLAHADGRTSARGALPVPEVRLWWPHTHGEPALYDVRLRVRTSAGPATVHCGRVGFRAIQPGPSGDHDVAVDGLDLQVNGVRVFARGAVWTPADAVGMAPDEGRLRQVLTRVCDSGMNILRVPGTGAYESPVFHDLCDELGLLVWQDFMFANLDYPITDDAFRATVEGELDQVLDELAGRPSLAVLCGNSEVEQQVAMLGLDPALGRGELFGEMMPARIAGMGLDSVYVPSAPSGEGRPFRPDRGIAHYFGVGGYRRGLEDARRSEVRFAAECLALSNVPDEAGVESAAAPGAPEPPPYGPGWKRGIPRDIGSGWDFEDVRDHYLESLYGVDAAELRRLDPERYLELSRAVTGELMAEVFGEWRRASSPCGGALVLWLGDLLPGAGWGVLDHTGNAKPAYHHLRRALAPVTVWMTDEGLGGIRAHVANDRATPLSARLRVALYRDGEHPVAAAERSLDLPPRAVREFDVEQLLGRFADVSWSYRFGPPAHDTVVASLEHAADDGGVLAQAFRFPAGRPLRRQAPAELGLTGALLPRGDGSWVLELSSTRLAYGVRIHVDGFRSAEDALTLEPGHPREILLVPDGAEAEATRGSGHLTALNLRGRVPLTLAEPAA